MKDEKMIKGSVEPVNMAQTETILNQMKNCICKIIIRNTSGTGFFCRIPELKKNFLFTNYHIINENYIKENKEINILLDDNKKDIKIDLGIKRVKYFNKEYDITLIELKKIDKIKEYLELDDDVFKDNQKAYYEEKKSLYILHYINGKNICVSYGLLNKIDNYDIIHLCSTDNGSSGSPIINLENNKVIGIHKQGSVKFNFNKGTLLKYPLDDFINKYNENKDNNNLDKIINNDFIPIKEAKTILFKSKNINIFAENNNNIIVKNNNNNIINENKDNIIIEKIKNDSINVKDKNINIKNEDKANFIMNENKINTIIGEINIKKTDINSDIPIINSYENFIRKYSNLKVEDEDKYKNEKEIKENIEIKINEQKIEFSYNYKFTKEGKYKIEYLFKKILTKTCFLFYDCYSLIDLNLSNFNTQNITNISHMFGNCNSLTNINLSNFNTQNVTNMNSTFSGCSSLIKIIKKYIN